MPLFLNCFYQCDPSCPSHKSNMVSTWGAGSISHRPLNLQGRKDGYPKKAIKNKTIQTVVKCYLNCIIYKCNWLIKIEKCVTLKSFKYFNITTNNNTFITPFIPGWHFLCWLYIIVAICHHCIILPHLWHRFHLG